MDLLASDQRCVEIGLIVAAILLANCWTLSISRSFAHTHYLKQQAYLFVVAALVVAAVEN